MSATDWVNAVVVLTTLIIALVSFIKRGATQDKVGDAIQDGFSVSQLPVGGAIILGLLRFLDASTMSKIMIDSAAGLWAAILFIIFGCVALANLSRL